jgi:hypothetical protein
MCIVQKRETVNSSKFVGYFNEQQISNKCAYV